MISKLQYCEWCKREAEGIFPHKDFEEGMAGREYDVCLACRKKEAAYVQEELDSLNVEDWYSPDLDT